MTGIHRALRRKPRKMRERRRKKKNPKRKKKVTTAVRKVVIRKGRKSAVNGRNGSLTRTTTRSLRAFWLWLWLDAQGTTC